VDAPQALAQRIEAARHSRRVSRETLWERFRRWLGSRSLSWAPVGATLASVVALSVSMSLYLAVPSPDQRPERLRSVLHVLYLLFNEGYTSSSGPDLARSDLSGLGLTQGRARAVQAFAEAVATDTVRLDRSVSLDQLRIETWWLARARNEEFFDAGDWPGCSCLRYPGVSGRFGTYSGSRLKRRCITRPYQTTEHA